MNTLDDLDQATADRLVAELGHITLDRPTPQLTDRQRGRWLAAAAVGLVVAAGAVVAWPSGSDDVYAGWTPIPRTAQPGEVAEVLSVCNARTHEPESGLPIDPFGDDTVVEFRGLFALALATADDTVARCTARDQETGWYAFGFGTTPVGHHAPMLQGGGSPDYMLWLLHGVHPDAARVELTVPGYPLITATVIDGAYFAWWPEDRPSEWPDERSLRDGRLPDRLPELRVDIYDADNVLVDSVNW